MRIVFVCSSLLTTTGGIETTVASLARELSARHSVVVLAGRGPDTLRIGKGVEVFALPFLNRESRIGVTLRRNVPRYDPFFFESLTLNTALARSFAARRTLSNADVVSFHSKYDCMFLSRRFASWGIPSVFHVQGAKFGRTFQSLSRVSRYVAVSETTRRDLSLRFGLPFTATVTPGIPDKLLEMPRVEEDVVLFVGRLQPSKGTVEAIQVFHEVSRPFPNLRLVVIGDGPGRSQMEAEARERGVADRVSFLGSVPQEEVFRHYAKAKIVLFPSRVETYPLVPLEAMAAGCPVIAYNIPGVLESTGGHVALVEPGNHAALANAATDLLRDRGRRAELSSAGRSWAANHTWSNSSRLYLRELEEAARGRLGNPLS